MCMCMFVVMGCSRQVKCKKRAKREDKRWVGFRLVVAPPRLLLQLLLRLRPRVGGGSAAMAAAAAGAAAATGAAAAAKAVAHAGRRGARRLAFIRGAHRALEVGVGARAGAAVPAMLGKRGRARGKAKKGLSCVRRKRREPAEALPAS